MVAATSSSSSLPVFSVNDSELLPLVELVSELPFLEAAPEELLFFVIEFVSELLFLEVEPDVLLLFTVELVRELLLFEDALDELVLGFE